MTFFMCLSVTQPGKTSTEAEKCLDFKATDDTHWGMERDVIDALEKQAAHELFAAHSYLALA